MEQGMISAFVHTECHSVTEELYLKISGLPVWHSMNWTREAGDCFFFPPVWEEVILTAAEGMANSGVGPDL